jgi:release factor glutamine methyltransferase
LDFCVNPSVLIPRPETEQLVEHALDWANKRGPLEAVDVGTGSGCVAVCLARQLPYLSISATDISSAALVVARKNAERYGPGRIRFYEGNLLMPVPAPADLIIANLPYVSSHEWTMVDDGVKWYEPMIALKGGSDGLDLISELLQQAMSRLRPGGAIFLEIGWQQGQAVLQLARNQFPAADIALIADYAGQDRIVTVCTG